MLTLVGFYYSPDLAVADARVREADAAVITAGAVPNPTAHVGPQFREAISPNFPPWGIGSFTLDLPIETAGKRGYRTAEAQRLADAARLAAGEAAWGVRSRIRVALLQYLLDLRERDLSAHEEDALAQVVRLFEQRVRTGAASQPELYWAQSGLQGAKLKFIEIVAACRLIETYCRRHWAFKRLASSRFHGLVSILRLISRGSRLQRFSGSLYSTGLTCGASSRSTPQPTKH